jgi:hypothetical protein
MDVWRSESSPGKQTAMSTGCAVVGVILAYGFHNFNGNQDRLAGFILGMLLLVVGIWGFLSVSKQTIAIDPTKRLITVEDAGYLGAKQKIIYFDDIEEIGIGFLGKKSNYVTWYYLNLKLRSGGHYSLFAPGRFYEGGSDRFTVEGWQRRLEQLIARQ